MTDEQIEQALKVCEAASPGPLGDDVVEDNNHDDYAIWAAIGPRHRYIGKRSPGESENLYNEAARDADFIAAARTGYPEALKELQEAREKLAEALRVISITVECTCGGDVNDNGADDEHDDECPVPMAMELGVTEDKYGDKLR